MMIEAVESYRAARDHHLAAMQEECKRILVFRIHEFSERDVAEREGLSVSSVRRHLDGALASIFDALDVKRSPSHATFWACSHELCCLAAAFHYVCGDTAQANP